MKKILEDMRWNENTASQKRKLLAFGFFASMTVAFIWSWLALPFGIAAYHYYKQIDKCIVGE